MRVIDVKAHYSLEERYDLGELVTFVPNKRLPIYNWFYYKEGFSRDFVKLMFEWFKTTTSDHVLDPFCGVGTTLLTSKEAGMDSSGVDSSPLAMFAAQVKTSNYDVDELREVARNIFAERFERPSIVGFSPLVKRAFSKFALEDIVFFKERIRGIEDLKLRNIFTLALMSAANKVSYAYKDGAMVKVQQGPRPPLKKVFKRVVKRMIKDLRKVQVEPCETTVYLGDARRMSFLAGNEFDIVITSPPYLNKIEYTKVYSVEYELFFPDAKADGVRSYLGFDPRNVKSPFPDIGIPPIAEAYFQDMQDALVESYRVTKSGARCAIVLAEGAFPDVIVPTDLLTAELAERAGFKVEKIVVVNSRVVTRERTIKIGRARESVLILNK